MPVLFAPSAHATRVGAPYLLLAFVVLSLCSLVWRRRRGRSRAAPPAVPYGEATSSRLEKNAERVPSPRQVPACTSPMPVIATAGSGSGPKASLNDDDDDPASSPRMTPVDATAAEGPGLPRRRSYAKTTPAGVAVQGEVVMAEGWRRHTRVFGGGVCLACAESDQRTTA